MNREDFLKSLLEHESRFEEQTIPSPSPSNVVPFRAPDPEPPPETIEQPPINTLAPLPLGYDHDIYYYLSRLTKQIHEIPSTKHGSGSLISMAPLSFWQHTYKGGKGVDWQAASDAMIASCHAVGIYNPERLRGRGVSYDNGRVVLHLGDKLIVDGIEHPLTLNKSQFIYEKMRPMEIGLGVPLSDAEAYKLIEVANKFSWSSGDMGLLLAGWLVTAPVCGALPWRTHLWMTGSAGAGKSYVMSRFVKPIIGTLGFFIQSKTTEAGIRQHLRFDSRPVIFDEADTQNETDRQRLQQILDLARQSSSEDGFQILKGTITGKEMKFRIQSSFLFSSINFGATQSADESRIIQISLVPMEQAEIAIHFDEIKRIVGELLTPEFSGRLLARTLNLLPTIRANISVFSRALSESLPSRQADTIGSVVAGVYSLFSSSSLSYQEALSFTKDKQWIMKTAHRTSTDSDHTKAVAHFLEYIIRHGHGSDFSISEAIILSNASPDHDIRSTLARNGIKIIDKTVYLARGHSSITEIFERTPWAKVWDKTFLQWNKFQLCEHPIDYAGTRKKSIMIRIDDLLEIPQKSSAD